MRKDLPLSEALRQRRSVRQFKTDPVPQDIILAMLDLAGRSPSGTNMQPWKVYVANGPARDRVSAAVLDAAARNARSQEYVYAPDSLGEPYLSRRRQIGYALYQLHGIERHDMEARTRVALQNFTFFDAPVGLFFTMDRHLTPGQWMDCGMFMQSVMLAALAFGLNTCPQQAWCNYGAVVHDTLGIPPEEILLSGMALGYADEQAVVNTLQSPRVPASEFARFV